MLATRNFLQVRLASTNALLAVVCLAQFMILLDVSIVNVALPSIRDGLHFSTTGLQWVVNAYTLTFAGLLMLGGRSADLLGRRRVFLAGTATFALSSLLCALASSRGLLVGARGVQGIAGAITSPATLSIITSTLPEGRERNRGLALWGAMAALGASSGALLGGLLTQAFGWEAIFAVNIPLGAVIVGLGLLAIPAIAAGMLVLSGIAPGQNYVGPILIGQVLTALGMGFGLVPSTIVAMQGVAGAQSGVASGLLNTSRLMGGALGLAVLSTIASGQAGGAVGAAPVHALTNGFDLAFTVAVGFAVIAALVAAYALRPEAATTTVAELGEPIEADERQALAA